MKKLINLGGGGHRTKIMFIMIVVCFNKVILLTQNENKNTCSVKTMTTLKKMYKHKMCVCLVSAITIAIYGKRLSLLGTIMNEQRKRMETSRISNQLTNKIR